MIVNGLRLSDFAQAELTIYVESIAKASIIEASYCEVSPVLLNDISAYPNKYSFIFSQVLNLKILDYLSECNRLDTTPYKTNYTLIDGIDESVVVSQGVYALSSEQFCKLVRKFQTKSLSNKTDIKINALAMNVLSIHTKKGLYILACRKLYLDVVNKSLRADDEITVNKEFTIDGEKVSIRKFLDESDMHLLDSFDKNLEKIKDIISAQSTRPLVDDLPHFVAIGYDIILDLQHQYKYIIEMFDSEKVSDPIRAFFGEIKERPRRIKDYSIVLLDQKSNIDQLLAIHNAIKYPVTYIQGPPGTGKTNTILKIIMTAFYHEKSVLACSYNNTPIDGIFSKLQEFNYRGRKIPFPIIRLGNSEKTKESIKHIKDLFDEVKSIQVFEGTLNKNKEEQEEKNKKLTQLLKKYEEKLDLEERREALVKILDANKDHFNLVTDLQAKQLVKIDGLIAAIGEITDKDALDILNTDSEDILKYIYYTSAKYIKRLGEPKYDDLREILYLKDEDIRLSSFNKYLSNGENLERFMRIFPIICTTNISAAKLGEPGVYFDYTVMDEASQCNTAVSLVPILRGRSLVLVGDPQQLNPVIVLDSKVNCALRSKYNIPDSYDYVINSVYKCFLTNDAISDEILLSYHYRCHKSIIGFNNKKFYNNKLKVYSERTNEKPLTFLNVKSDKGNGHNVAIREIEEIVSYIKKQKNKSLGVITPFVNQREQIKEYLARESIADDVCGTVHAFQGEEKDIILFSLALTADTSQSTYEWLKNNKELINVATSRPREQLIILGDAEQIKRLHNSDDDDLYELCKYVSTQGNFEVSSKAPLSRALGIKPYSTETENAFMGSLTHALSTMPSNEYFAVKKEVPISAVFNKDEYHNDLFFTGRFDFVVFQKRGKEEWPILAVELDGIEHKDNPIIIERDRKKQQICKQHKFDLIRIPNSYARRYHHIKEILISYFK